MKFNSLKVRWFVFIVVVALSVGATLNIVRWQKENGSNKTQQKVTTTTSSTNSTSQTKISKSTSATTSTNITTTTSAPTNMDNMTTYDGNKFKFSYPNNWVETSSQPNYLLLSSQTDSTNLSVKNDESITDFPGYERSNQENVLVFGEPHQLKYWQPLAIDDDFGSSGLNSLMVVNLSNGSNKAVLIYSYQKGFDDSKKADQFKKILSSFSFK